MLNWKKTIHHAKKDLRFFPYFRMAATGVIPEIIAAPAHEIVAGPLFDDNAFASPVLTEPYTFFEVFIASLVDVGAAAPIARAHSAGDQKRKSSVRTGVT